MSSSLYSDYLNIYRIFAFEIIGNEVLFVILGIGAVFYFGMKAKIPTFGLFLLSVLWSLMIFTKSFMISILAFVVMIVGFIFYKRMSRMINS